MRPNTINPLFFALLLTLLLSGCACLRGPYPMGMGKHPCQVAQAPVQAAASQAETRQDVLYTCNCGPQCTCKSVSTQPGNCACGSPMKWGHLLKVEGNEAILCTCGKGCQCALDPDDPTRCGCGNPVKRANLQGTGIYFCNCGGACFCNTASAGPGMCKCGMPLKKVD